VKRGLVTWVTRTEGAWLLQQSAELMYRTARLNAGDRAYRHLAKPQQREAAALTAAARVLATGEAL